MYGFCFIVDWGQVGLVSSVLGNSVHRLTQGTKESGIQGDTKSVKTKKSVLVP